MTIANELQLLQTNLTASYTACNDKGATMPVNQNFSNLASCIDTIPTGGGSPDLFGILFKGEIDANGVYTLPYDLTYTGNISFDGVKSLKTYSATSGGAFANYLYHEANQALRMKCRLINGTISFPDLESVNGKSAFASICNGQTLITKVYFPKLATITGGGTGGSNTNNFYYAFKGCTSLTDIYFNAVTSANASTFKAQLGTTMLNGVTNCKVHFPSNLASIIGAATFGGSGNTGTVFDLPATE